MKSRHTALALAGAIVLSAACTESPVTPAATLTAVPDRSLASSTEDVPELAGNHALAEINASLALAGSNVRIAKAEFIVDVDGHNEATSQTVFANDRARGIGSEWVVRDPRRDGRVGISWAFGSSRPSNPFVRNADGSGVRQLTLAEQATFMEEGMNAWDAVQCSSAPVARVGITAGTDPDMLDEFFRGLPPSANYVQPADIVQSSWQPSFFFRNIAIFFDMPPASGDNILGVTFTLVFVDADGNPTDIDGNGKDDIGLAELFYNARFFWGNSGASNVVDIYSIVAHESGHAFGLGHFGKVFVTKKAASDGISISDIKVAPEALMNALYITGRSEILGTDNSSFCQIWGSAN